MMKNILVISNMYLKPFPNYQTPTVHYFTKEWVKMGYKVKVIHNRTTYPIVFYWIASLFHKQVLRFMGNYIETKRNSKCYCYHIDDVHIYSMPIFKWIPHGKYQKRTITKQLNRIIEINQFNGFIPDAIIGHVYNPQIELVSKLKKVYPKARTCIVMHESPSLIKKTYSKHYPAYFNNIDIMGFRKKAFKKEFENLFGNNHNTFICHSGIPDKYISSFYKKFKNKVKKFCFVGQLIPLKRVGDILVALNNAFPLNDFEFVIVGEGFERKKLEETVEFLGIKSNVRFTGKLKRDDVSKVLSDSDCFVMVSETEAFGLVYLEAMGKGCITIGTEGQGIDGVIHDGKNGFLCEAKNADRLAEIFRHISSLSEGELSNISKKALETAINMTDRKVAENYINTLSDCTQPNKSMIS